MKNRRPNQESGWQILYVVLVGAIILIVFPNWGYDDPYITYRYAQNIANGLGFVYNPGEKVLSTTTPFFTLLLAGASMLGAPEPLAAQIIGAFSLAATGIFLAKLAKNWSTEPVGWFGLLMVPTFPLFISSIGSETTLFIAFTLGAFAIYAQSKYLLTGILVGFAALTRPDGLLVAALLAGHYLWRHKRPFPRKAVLAFLALTLPWIVFSWAYFGSPIPATLAAKQAQGMMPISQGYIPGLLHVIKRYSETWSVFWIAAPVALIGIYYALSHAHPWLLLFAWAVLHSLVYILLGVSRYFWYYAPLGVGFVAAAGLGFTAIWRWWKSLVAAQPGWASKDQPAWVIKTVKQLPWLLTVLLLGGSFFSLQNLAKQGDPRRSIYYAAGEWLYANTTPRSSVAALEVGIIGYYAGRPMIDFAGLLQPEIARQLQHSQNYQDIANWVIERYHPDYVIVYRGWSQELESGRLSQNCRLVRSFIQNSGVTDRLNNLDIYNCDL